MHRSTLPSTVPIVVLALTVCASTLAPRAAAGPGVLPAGYGAGEHEEEPAEAGGFGAAGEDDVAALATAVREEIDARTLMERTEAIVQYDRLSGGPGERKAIEQIVEDLDRAGVPVEVHSFQALVSNPESASLEVEGLEGAPEAITVSFSGTVDGLEAPLVDVGSVEDLPDVEVASGELLGLEPSAAATVPDVSDGIALVEGLPMPQAAWVLERLGAAGAVFVNPEERLNELVTTTVWGTPSLRNDHRVPELPVVEVRRSAGRAIRDLLSGDGVTARLSARAPLRWTDLRLAVATIPPAGASGDRFPFALLGGHIDSWHHGATDEGASNAAMVELALAFHRHRERMRRGLIVAWWPGHSNARYAGSAWYADRRFRQLRERAVAYLNVDGIGQRGARRFSASATASLRDLAKRVGRERVGESDLPVRRPGRNSDQSFNGIGLPLLQFHHRGEYGWWHTPDDTLDKIDPEVLETDTGLYVDALAELLSSPTLPVSPSAAVEELADLVGDRQAATGGRLDLERRVDELRELRGLAQRIETLVGDGAAATVSVDAGASDTGSSPTVESSVLRVLRPLHRVVYTLDGPFHPDPAVELGALPGLGPAELLASESVDVGRRRFAKTTLIRERNRLEEAVEAATAEARRLLRRLEAR